MIEGIDLSQRIKFSCKDDKEPKTVFIMRPLSGLEMLDMAQYVKGAKLSLNTDYVKNVLGKVIVEIKNPDITGNQINDYIQALRIDVLTELIVEAGRINNLTEKEAKN